MADGPGAADALLDAAQVVLDRDGFHGATFAAVAVTAGRDEGEVSAAFGDVGRMFLATVDRFLATQMGKYDEDIDAADFEEAARRYGDQLGRARLADGMPSWDRVLIEFWIVASRDPSIRDEVRVRNTANLDRVGALLAAFAGRYGRELVLAPREVARGLFSLGRGMGLERVMDDTWDPDEFAEMFVAYFTGLTRPRNAHATSPALS